MRAFVACIQRTALTFLTTVLAACGGGGEDGGGPPPPPPPVYEATVTFPPAYATTSASEVAVTGKTENAADVTGVLVNGAAATSSDGFATWRARVVLVPGDNTVDILVERTGGSRVEATTKIHRGDGLFLQSMLSSSFAYHRASRTVYAADTTVGIVAIDIDTCERTLIEDAPGTRIAVDQSTGLLYREERRTIWQVNPTTGARVEIAAQGDGRGPDYPNVRHLAVDATTGVLFIVSFVSGGDEVYAVKLSSGSRSLLTGTGPTLEFVKSVDAPGDGKLYLLNGSPHNQLLSVDPGSGDRVVEADSVTGHTVTVNAVDRVYYSASSRTLFGASFGNSSGAPIAMLGDAFGFYGPTLWWDSAHQTIVAAGLMGMEEVHLHPPSVSPRCNLGHGSGPLIHGRRGPAVASGERIVLPARDSLVEVDRTTGERIPLPGSPAAMTNVAAHAGANVVYALDFAPLSTLHAFDLTTQASILLSGDGQGTGPSMDVAKNELVVAPSGTVYLMGDDDVLAVDPVTGDRTSVLNGDALPNLLSAYRMSVGPDGELYLADGNEVLRLDPATGDLETVVEGTDLLGSGADFGPQLALPIDGHVVAFDHAGRMVAVDPTGAAQLVITSGPRTLDPQDVSRSTHPHVFYVKGRATAYAVDWPSGDVVVIAH